MTQYAIQKPEDVVGKRRRAFSLLLIVRRAVGGDRTRAVDIRVLQFGDERIGAVDVAIATWRCWSRATA